MAGHGPPPKNPAQRRRRNAEPPRKTLDPAVKASAPALPGEHLAETERWYETWASSPQAARFLATDWQRLHMLAPLVDLYWANPSKDLMGEIRLNEAKLGATEDDRLRLRWDVSDGPAAPTSTAPKSDRKAEALRLLRGEAG